MTPRRFAVGGGFFCGSKDEITSMTASNAKTIWIAACTHETNAKSDMLRGDSNQIRGGLGQLQQTNRTAGLPGYSVTVTA